MWNFTGSYYIPAGYDADPVYIPVLLNNPNLIIEASSNDAQPNWYRAGWLSQITDLSGVGSEVQISNHLIISEQKLILLDGNYLPYSLKFTPVKYLTYLDLKIWEKI
jgi:hypothetical protein